MDIVHAGSMDWGENLAAHRHGGMAHKLLFEGKEGSPDNYALVLANESAEYYSPRHRHCWDQVRFCLEGSVPIGPNLAVDAGEAAYFPEGVAYGPQEGGPDRIELLLQFGGASGQGYLSAAQLRRARAELAHEGTFERGVFRRTSGNGKKNEDAYEAIWRHVTGKPIDYSKPRYKAPIIMRADAFAWTDVARAPGVKRKSLGVFPDRGLELDLLALSQGARFDMAASRALKLVFVRAGEGTCDHQPYFAQSTIRLQPGEHPPLVSATLTELFVISVAPVLGRESASSNGP
ncbi:MAG TPA: hypothetical protein VEH07_08955 [Alphaproteobacteria bacterium]|nr:hypothetical protein [Alphaproteobacteria bacterium]